MKIGIIYKIAVKESGEVYIGSTFRNLKKRYQEHIYNWIHCINGMGSCYLFNKYSPENCFIQELETIQVKNKFELRNQEQKYINKYGNSCVNSYKSCIGADLSNSSQYIKIYYLIFKNKLSEYQKTKIKCKRCHSFVSRRNYQAHYKTTKCFKHSS
jgi:hypothetical protein